MTKTKIFLILIFTLSAFPVSAQRYISADAIKTTVINAEELKSLVKSPEKKQPILINFWATWCGPCRAEFPDLIEIHKDYREKGLNFFIVSLDKAVLADTLVSDFLKSYKAEMPSYLLDIETRPQINRAIRQIVPRYAGGFPFTVLFNENGKPVYKKSGVIDAKILRAQIDKVISR